MLKKVSAETKKRALFWYVNGLCKRALGDFQGALDDFTKAMEIDPEMTDARRDRAAVKNLVPQKSDILNGDISQVFTNIFKKKTGS